METEGLGLSSLSLTEATCSQDEKCFLSCEEGENENNLGGLSDLSDLPVERTEGRPTCSRCSRPQKVCLCPFLPVHPLDVSTCLYIVQHPAEESRVLRTVPLLAACLPPGNCKVLVGRRFSEDRYPELASVCKSPGTLILYPGSDAENLEELDLNSSAAPYNIIIIDGTWSQAKDMFLRNPLFHLPKQPAPLRRNEPAGGSSAARPSTAGEERAQQQIKRKRKGIFSSREKLGQNPEKYKQVEGTGERRTETRAMRIGPVGVQLKTSLSSQYVIRTQPTNTCLSTLECAAIALSIMEKNDSIQEVGKHHFPAPYAF
ncbi:UNVERIFIED_CONTAM: hypothetical protein FKN15_042456 [Acipenser sinensis]